MNEQPPKDCREPSECRSCKALVLWVTWPASGKRMPVDVTPHPIGTVLVSWRARENKLLAEKYDPKRDDHQNRNRFMSHFATCIYANQHRKSA